MNLLLSFIISAFGVHATVAASDSYAYEHLSGDSRISPFKSPLTISTQAPAPSLHIPPQKSDSDRQPPRWHPHIRNQRHKPNHISPQPSSNKAPSIITPISSPSPATPMSTEMPRTAFSPIKDCASIICSEPLTNTPLGSPCGCVWPMRVGMRISIPLYTLLLQVSELAKDIASGVFMRQSQLRITAAESDTQQPGKTLVSIDLVPLESKFDITSVYLARQRFLDKQIKLNTSIFGMYEVLYVNYPGLPMSPTTAPSSISEREDGPYFGIYNKTIAGKPFGADVHGKHIDHRRLSGSLIALISISVVAIVFLCLSITWVLLLKCTVIHIKSSPSPQIKLPSHLRPSGNDEFMDGSNTWSRSLSVKSSIAAYTGSAKTFCLAEIEKATCNFDASRLIGEGGFGLVYKGVLDDGTYAAIKVLKINHQHGDKEFMAEVDMLCRLHHRNLVKLIGICIEGHKRCVVYELIPNGSLESHLHGRDREKPPLDWSSRMKIALGAARGLAYLHEDSSPRVVHRDFKSSNILLENDFTPKVSDFGLAQPTLAAENAYKSTEAMGTFGYIAPEYALTGHFLVKSDVYSYGVVLLELLTGRKPVDMSQPLGQQNLVAWAHPLLNDLEGLKQAIDPSLGSDVPFDIIAKVAAIASMCAQPEVSHRPYMGEVVQALKLVFDETDESGISRSGGKEEVCPDQDKGMSGSSGNCPFKSQPQIRAYNSDTDVERGHSVSEVLDASSAFQSRSSASFRRHASSGPLRMGRGRRLWSIVRTVYGGSMSEHDLWRGSH
ncbi:hypothetical protein QQ045_027068 [Rhodiola kirilowii]